MTEGAEGDAGMADVAGVCEGDFEDRDVADDGGGDGGDQEEEGGDEEEDDADPVEGGRAGHCCCCSGIDGQVVSDGSRKVGGQCSVWGINDFAIQRTPALK